MVVDHPNLVRNLHQEFVHAGSDVVEAFTYYGHREKLRLIGREAELEQFNRSALQIARQVADETGALMAGNICNTTIFKPNDRAAEQKIRDMFKEQIQWAVEEKADFIIAETYSDFEEAMIALQSILQHGNGLPAVVTMIPTSTRKTTEGVSLGAACQRLEEAGASVVGLNCYEGPDTVLPVIRDIRAACKGPIACLPSPYRAKLEDGPSFMDWINPITGKKAFPGDLDCFRCSRSQIRLMTEELVKIGVDYMGLCCGNQSHYTRAMSEALGRRPPASRYSPDMSQHFSNLTDDDHRWTQSNFPKLTGKLQPSTD